MSYKTPDEQLPLPCPFCDYKSIRIIEEKMKKGALHGSKFTYCWCPICGTRGPWAYNVKQDDLEIAKDCINRWNERGGIKPGQENE